MGKMKTKGCAVVALFGVKQFRPELPTFVAVCLPRAIGVVVSVVCCSTSSDQRKSSWKSSVRICSCVASFV